MTLTDVIKKIQPNETIEIVKWHDDKIELKRSKDGNICWLIRTLQGIRKTIKEIKYG